MKDAPECICGRTETSAWHYSDCPTDCAENKCKVEGYPLPEDFTPPSSEEEKCCDTPDYKGNIGQMYCNSCLTPKPVEKCGCEDEIICWEHCKEHYPQLFKPVEPIRDIPTKITCKCGTWDITHILKNQKEQTKRECVEAIYNMGDKEISQEEAMEIIKNL